MTRAHSSAGDNGGRCERCNRPETVDMPQTARAVMLGGGLGMGTLWLCASCDRDRITEDNMDMIRRAERAEREAKHWQGEAIAMRDRAEKAEQRAEYLREVCGDRFSATEISRAFGYVGARWMLVGRGDNQTFCLGNEQEVRLAAERLRAPAYICRIVEHYDPPAGPRCEICHRDVRDGMRFCSGLFGCYSEHLKREGK